MTSEDSGAVVSGLTSTTLADDDSTTSPSGPNRYRRGRAGTSGSTDAEGVESVAGSVSPEVSDGSEDDASKLGAARRTGSSSGWGSGPGSCDKLDASAA